MSLESVATGGIVVISPRDSSPYLLDLRTGQSRILPMYAPDSYSLDSMGVSPDRGRLAYVETIRNQANEIVGRQLRVVTADGQVQVSQTFELGWSWWRWLDNERLEIYWWEAPMAGTVIVLNLFTGQQQEIPPTFPDIYDVPYEPPYWMTLYSPDLKWVLYLSNGEEYYGEAVVWDIEAGQALWQSSGKGIFDDLPAWSPRNDQVAVVVGGKLFRVDHTGHAMALPDIGMEDVRDFGWSPDGRYIAFWASSPPWEMEKLYILDTTSDQVVDFCLSTLRSGTRPLWSPDSLQFSVYIAAEDANDTIKWEAVLVDIDKGIANRIPYNESPVGWMHSIP